MLAFLIGTVYSVVLVLAVLTVYHNRDDVARRVARAAIRVAVKFERGTAARRMFFRLNHKARRYAEKVVRAYAAQGIV